VNVANKRVLIFGDSLSYRSPDRDVLVSEVDPTRKGSPGDLLASWLLREGAAAVRIHAKVGRSAHNFWSSWEPDHDEVIAKLQAWKPDIAIIFLGTNDIGLNMAVDASDMARIRDAFSTAEVWGIGPPSFASQDLTTGAEAVVKMEKQVFGKRFIDARPLSSIQGRTSDGVHFTAAGARVFAANLADRLNLRRNIVALRGPLLGVASIAVAGALLALGFIIMRRDELGQQRRV